MEPEISNHNINVVTNGVYFYVQTMSKGVNEGRIDVE